MGSRGAALFVVVLACLAAAPLASAAPVPAGARWSQATIDSADGVKLHADVLRPAGVPAGRKVPVILSIGPYFNHSGQTGPAGPAENTSYDPVGPVSGPSDRFYDFVNGAKLMKRGYAYVMVDLRGFGGSSGCLDWGGPGEQADVVNAVRWAARQSWSSGKVGMYGKSYDGVTGLIGANKRPAGLSAVVSQEPVYDLYRYLYGDGIPRLNQAATPALYNLIAITPGAALDTPSYNIAAVESANPDCHVQNQLDQTGDSNHGSAYWKARNFIPGAKGSKVPLFLTQGLTENNTVADGTAQYLRNHTGYERAWLGPWEHVRGNETCTEDDVSTGCSSTNVGRLKMGRKGFFDEVMRFYGRFLKGEKPKADPQIAVQTNDGRWRAESVWPPKDSLFYRSTLRTGSYLDDGSGEFSGAGDEGVWTISPPLKYQARLAGSGRVTVKVNASAPNANLVVDVYDLNSAGKGPLITRQGFLVRSSGTLNLDLWSADWKIVPGHRIGIRIIDANNDWWNHVPSNATVTVQSASANLPFLRVDRPGRIQGNPGVQLADYLSNTVQISASTLASATSNSFRLPPKPLRSKLIAGFGRQKYRSGNGRSFRVRCRVRDTVTRRTCLIVGRYKPRHRKQVVIARGKRVLGVGKRSAIVRVKLTKRGRRLLKRGRHGVKQRLYVRATDKYGRVGKKNKRARLGRTHRRR